MNTIRYTTLLGGTSYDGSVAVLKQPVSPGGAWTRGLLHMFTGSDGSNPIGLAEGGGGVLYGVTSGGGANGEGTVFEITGL